MGKLVIFDLDGTLVDSVQDLADALNSVRISYGAELLPVDTVKNIIGDGIKVLVQRALQDVDADLILALTQVQKFYAEHLTDNTVLYQGVFETLQKLRRSGMIMAVVTNKNSREASRILQELKVADVFSDIIGGDSGFRLKPDPEALISLQQKYGVEKKDCWMVGDHFTDLESGRRAGFKRIFCTYGFGQCREEIPDFTVDSFDSIADII